MHDDGTLYYAHYTPQLHYRGIALDDDDNNDDILTHDLRPCTHPLAQRHPDQPYRGVNQLGQCAEVMHRLLDDLKLCTMYRSLPVQAANQASHPGPNTPYTPPLGMSTPLFLSIVVARKSCVLNCEFK